MGKLGLAVRAAILFAPLTAGAVTWQVELIDHTGAGRFSSLRVDKSGNAHVAFVVDDGARYPLKYGFWDHALKKWFVMNVDERASFCSLALDSKQRPHISYVDYGTMDGAKLHYAYWDGTAWKKEIVPINAETIAYYTSILLDSNDYPSMSFYEYNGPRGTDLRVRMRVVTWNGSYWQVMTVDGQNQSGKFNQLAIDSKGRMHLAYANVNAMTASMRYGIWNGKVWNTEVVDAHEQNNEENVGYSAAIAVDSKDVPHLTYMNYTSPSLKYAVKKAGVWQTQVIDRLAGVGYPDRNAITLDDQGNPYIAYYDAGRGIMKLAHAENGKWFVEVVDGNGCGATSALVIHDGTVWLSYADEGNGGLKVARRELQPAKTTQTLSQSAVGRP